MFRDEVKQKIAEELRRGEAARKTGMEGRARVCARRAAGEAVREALAQRGRAVAGPSAVDMLAALREDPETSAEVRAAAERLLMRVDEGYTLPKEIDLLADARMLVEALQRG
jgi:hypothetical protein